MGFRTLFITAIAALIAATAGFFVLRRAAIPFPVAGPVNLPTIGARASLPPASPGGSPPVAGEIVAAPEQPGASPGQPLFLDGIVEPIQEVLEGVFNTGLLPAIPAAPQQFFLQPEKSAPPLQRYDDLVKPGAPFLFPPRYVHYLRVIRRIMVLNGAVAGDFYPEIHENRDAVAIMERFVDYILSPDTPSVEREGRRARLVGGIRYDLRLLAQEYPAGFPRPTSSAPVPRIAAAAGSEKIHVAAPPERFFGTLFNLVIPRALAQEAGPSIQDAELRAEIDALFGEAETVAPTESQNPATCSVVTADDFQDCWRGKGPNPAPGVNLWAPCCNCSVPVYGYCVPIGCKNLVCKIGNLIWDPATGICGCDQF